MAYPRKLLTSNESVDIEMHPHWKALVVPVFILMLTAAVGSFAASSVPAGGAQQPLRIVIAVIALGVLIIGTLIPFLRWVTTHYVVTDRRLITRQGIIARNGRDMPLARINDISFSHTVFERMLRSGTLVVESAGERGQLTLLDVPRVEHVQRRLYELAEAVTSHDEHSHDGNGGEQSA